LVEISEEDETHDEEEKFEEGRGEEERQFQLLA
jgi:hypothetical protein